MRRIANGGTSQTETKANNPAREKRKKNMGGIRPNSVPSGNRRKMGKICAGARCSKKNTVPRPTLSGDQGQKTQDGGNRKNASRETFCPVAETSSLGGGGKNYDHKPGQRQRDKVPSKKKVKDKEKK